MKEFGENLIRKLVSPSARFRLRGAITWLREIIGRLCFWRWELARYSLRDDSPYYILYVGRKIHRELAKALIGATVSEKGNDLKLNQSTRRVIVSELPILGALCVPHLLSAIVPLGRSIEEIAARYNTELRRNLRKNRQRYHMRQAMSEDEIKRADWEMLQPYARARHGAGASQIGLDEVRRLAISSGRLDFVMVEDEVVACHLGCVITRAGKRYWSTIRFGYPESVFPDAKRLREINSITTYLALEWAIENGFDYYDIGTSLARPDEGLLEWKRRRGGDLDSMGNHGYFYIKLPKVGSAQFLWDAPLFAVEGKQLTLHLGLPDGRSDEEVAIRYREMGFGGLVKVYLHYARAPGELLLETLRSRYTHLKSPPILESIPST